MLSIPSEEQRLKIYQKLKQRNQNDSLAANNGTYQIQTKKKRVLTSKQADEIVQRLSMKTKKENALHEQINKLKNINMEKKKKNISRNKVQERLIEKGEQIKQKKQIQQMNSLRESDKALQQKPNISLYAKEKANKEYKPFLQRVKKNNNAKELLMKKLAEKYQPSFQPQINSFSKFIAQVSCGLNENFLDRLDNHEKKRRQTIQILQRKKSAQQMEDVSFQPLINPISRMIAGRYQEKQRSKVSKQQENKVDFHPRINSKSCRLVKEMRERDGSICYERLYDDMKRVSEKKKKMKNQQESAYNFRPCLNKKSLEMAEKQGRQVEQNSFQEVFIEGPECQGLFEDQSQQYWSKQTGGWSDKGEDLYRQYMSQVRQKESKVTYIE